ncbi:hypothetical protein HYT92_03765 [Candidatus Pacearchaeota archaeon]|nr:hypothetical protein [Candidatus Pacearchaeota archaeon]
MAEAVPPQPAALPAEQKKEKGALENLVDELWDFGKKAVAVGAIAAMPLLYSFVAPTHVARAAVTTYGFAAGKVTANIIQNQDPLRGAPRQAFFGDVLSAPLAIGFTQLNNLESTVAANYGATAGKVAKVGSLLGIHQPAISTMRTGLEYGLGKEFRKNWWPDLKDVYKFLSIFSIPNVLWVYQYGLFPQMAVSAGLSYVFSLVKALRQEKGSIKNLFSALNPFSYIGAAMSATYKLAGNAIGGIYYRQRRTKFICTVCSSATKAC